MTGIEVDLSINAGLKVPTEMDGKVVGTWNGCLFDLVCRNCPVGQTIINENDATNYLDTSIPFAGVTTPQLGRRARRLADSIDTAMEHGVEGSTLNGRRCDKPGQTILGSATCRAIFEPSYRCTNPR